MSQIRPINPRLENFEQVLQRTGWGLYYKFLVGFCAANLFCNGLALLCMHFAMPISSCDTLLSVNDLVNIVVCFSIGKAFGGFLLASISDNTGKKCMISKTLMVIFASCFVCAFSHNIYTLYFAAFFLGSGIEANTITCKIHLAEILPMTKRGFYLVLPDLFWTCGYFLTTIFLYLMEKHNYSNTGEHQGMDMRLTSWRIIFAIAGGLSITMGCTSALLEMSPRFLLFKRRVITASLVLKQFYAINKSKYSETFDIPSQQLSDYVSNYDINIDQEPVGFVQQINNMLKVMVRMLKILMKNPFCRVVITLILIRAPLFFGVAGLNIFLAQHLRYHPNATVKGSDFVHLPLNTDENNCQVMFNETEYEHFLLLSVNILIGQILLLCIIDRIGRKFPICAGLTTCSLASIMLAFNEHFATAMAISSLFVIGYAMVESAFYVVVIESFPTAVRGTATGTIYFYSSICSCFMYILLDVNHQEFLTIAGIVILGTSVVSCCIPELSRRPMVE